jgi:predicted RNase H-like HicB family nuclease
MKLKVIIHEAEEGGYWAEVPALSGCFSQGETLDEIMENIREAAEGWLLASEDLKTTGNDRIAEVVI